jgi:uncharacterized protein YndB with AHSA1/START domain
LCTGEICIDIRPVTDKALKIIHHILVMATMKHFTRCSLMFRSFAVLLLAASQATHAAQTSLSTEAIINLPIANAWALFTSDTGLKSLGYTQTKATTQLGGQLQASGGAVALSSLSGEIISLDPEHMLSFKPVAGAANNHWTVVYFTAMGKDMTQLRWLEFFPDTDRAAVSANQQQVRTLFDQLIRRYAPECEVCKLEREGAEAGK